MHVAWGFPDGSDDKESTCNAGDPRLITGSGRSPGEGNGTPLQYSCLENPMDRGVWWATVHRVQFSCPVMSDSLRPHEPQHARPPCPSPTPGVYPNSCPLSRSCHPTISSSVAPFSSCPQSFPASGSFLMIGCLHWVVKVLELRVQHQSFWEYLGLVSFRID